MKTQEITVTARDGSGLTVQAELLLCAECGEAGPFFVYAVDGRHLHFQCSRCTMTFCDNSCLGVV
jgi:hypothetical protein